MPLHPQAEEMRGSLQLAESHDPRRQHTERSEACPVAYFITFRTYGTWLPGDERGYVHRNHNGWNTPYLSPCPVYRQHARDTLRHAPVILRNDQRIVVHLAIEETCQRLGWALHAVNVRTNHVHVVVTAPAKPERVLHALKAWSTRRLVESGVWEHGERVWVRHGSTRYLWTQLSVRRACDYVIEGQGG